MNGGPYRAVTIILLALDEGLDVGRRDQPNVMTQLSTNCCHGTGSHCLLIPQTRSPPEAQDLPDVVTDAHNDVS